MTAWTRDDLPHAEEARDVFMETPFGTSGFEAMLDAVVAHLNAHHHKPEPDRLQRQAATIRELQGSFLRVEADSDRRRRDRWRVEQERDRARGERDEWKARAEAAERERDAALQQLAEAKSEVPRWEQNYLDADTKARHATVEANNLKLELNAAVEARTVTREDVETAIQGCAGWHPSAAEARMQAVGRLANAVCDLFGIEAEPADLVEAKARELYALAHPGVFVPKGDDAELAPFRRLAAHVLGQEAGQ